MVNEIMEYDKINNQVAFQEKEHKYFNISDPSIKYTSVTTLIGKYEPEFDKEFVIPEPPASSGGSGFKPSVNDWDKEEGFIELK